MTLVRLVKLLLAFASTDTPGVSLLEIHHQDLYSLLDMYDSGAMAMLVDSMPQGTTINSDTYMATLKNLQAQLSCAQPHRQKRDVLLLYDNA
jgi:hypothetical protein